MMKFAAHIAVWWMALLMIALPMVPHHHHHGTLCVVMERCQSDGAINDQHTRHHHSDENHHHQDECVKSFKAVMANDPDHSDVDDAPLCTLLYAFVEQWIAEEHHAVTKLLDAYSIHYQSINAALSCALRAPPRFLSSVWL
ncbi:MAG: DUF6769 family protein [Sodaliphilus sp.]